MKKFYVVLFVVGFIFASCSSAFASDVVVVDIIKVVDQSKAAKSIRDQLKKKREKFQKDLTKHDDKLREKEKKLSEQSKILSPDALKKKQEEFKKEVIKVQRDIQVNRSKLDKAQAEALKQVREQVESIIQSLAKEKGFKMAVPRSQTLYAEDSLNITAEVLKQLNSKLPKVTVK